jgi:hypothetical protein
MADEKNNINKEKSWMRPVLFFYVKTTAWIIFPLILALLIGNYFNKSTQSQTFFLVCIMAGFGVTCSGVYKEIKNYKKDLEKKE